MNRPSGGSWLHRSARGAVSGSAGHGRAVGELAAAARAGDAAGVAQLLRPGVVLTVDGGGVVAAPDAAVEGVTPVASFLVDLLTQPRAAVRVESVNGVPGIVVCRDGRVVGVLSVRVRGRRILEAWLVANPDKLTRWTC
ncbi:hypothetical protein ACFT30_13765 [Microbacterium ureisolvens]|uniref:hypothetical protein n=1 Tax=Microbacterium ureisolvens TaxID=2781186 RepID=UPI00363DF49F